MRLTVHTGKNKAPKERPKTAAIASDRGYSNIFNGVDIYGRGLDIFGVRYANIVPRRRVDVMVACFSRPKSNRGEGPTLPWLSIEGDFCQSYHHYARNRFAYGRKFCNRKHYMESVRFGLFTKANTLRSLRLLAHDTIQYHSILTDSHYLSLAVSCRAFNIVQHEH